MKDEGLIATTALVFFLFFSFTTHKYNGVWLIYQKRRHEVIRILDLYNRKYKFLVFPSRQILWRHRQIQWGISRKLGAPMRLISLIIRFQFLLTKYNTVYQKPWPASCTLPSVSSSDGSDHFDLWRSMADDPIWGPSCAYER